MVVDLIAKLLTFYLVLFSLTVVSESSGSEKSFEEVSEALRYLIRNNKNSEALDLTFQYIEITKIKCTSEDIYLWASMAAKNIEDFVLARRFLSLALQCNPKRLLLWKELFSVGKDLPNFNKISFLNNAILNLNENDYFELWKEVNSHKTDDSRFKYLYSLTPAYSTNYNNGLLFEEIELFGLPFKTSKDSRKKKGFGTDLRLFGNFSIIENPLSSINLNLSLFTNDFPSENGDQILLNGELKYLDYSGENLKTLSYSFKRLEFAENSIFNSRRISLKKNYRIGYLSRFQLNLHERNFYDSEFRNGSGIQLETKYLLKNFSLSPKIEKYNAKSKAHSFKGMGFALELDKFPGLTILTSKKFYEDELSVFSKKREDRLTGINYKLSKIKLFNKVFMPSVNFVKIDSNISIYQSNRFELSFNYSDD